MIQIYADGVLVCDSRLEEHTLAGLKITRGLNKGGTAEIVMPPQHPAFGRFMGYRTIVEIFRDGVLKFRGRALYPIDDFDNFRTLVCEGELCFLQDAIARPYLHQLDPAAIFTALIDEYNAQVEPFKQFKVGTITVTDPNDYVRFESESAESVLAAINKLVERCGGYITFSYDSDGTRLINWLESVGRSSAQIIEAGENLFDFASSGANTDLATAVLPYGAKINESSRVDITTVNNGVDYIVDKTAAEIRGTIMQVVTWDDVTDPQNLLDKAREWLNENRNVVTTLTLTALDLSYIDKTVDSFDIGDRIRVISRAHGLDEEFDLTEQAEDLLNPDNSMITMGKEIRTLTRLDVAGDAKGASDLQQTAAEIRKEYELNLKNAAEQLRPEIYSLIQQEASNIKLEVSGGLGSKAQIILAAGSTPQVAELDLRQVRQAFAGDTSSVAINGGTIAFNSNTLIVNSTNLQVSADGTITATNAVLSGTATTESGIVKSELSAGRLRFFYDGTEYGGIASDHIAGTEAVRGVTVRLSEEASYMGFSRLDPELGMYSLWYCINFGANINDRTERHLFFGDGYFSNALTVGGAVYVYDAAIIYGAASISGAATFNNAATFNSVATFASTTTFNGAVVHNGNAFFANGKGVALYKTDGSTVFSMTMSTSDQLHIGTLDAPVYVYGSTTQLGLNSTPTTITGSTVSIANSVSISGAATFNNGYGVLIKTSSGSAQYVLSLNSSNQLSVGNAKLPLYLRGTGVTIPSGGLSLGKGSVILANGYGVVVCDSAGATHYVISLTSGNMVNVGTESYVTYLRGTAVYLASSGAAVTSDARKKHSVEDLGDAYEALIDKITPVRYKYNDGTSDRYHAGFIAQEVREALEVAGLTTQDFGGFVDLNGDGEELGLIYAEFIALLLNKIKRQEKRIAALEAVH